MVLPFATTDVTETLTPTPSSDPVNAWLDRVTRRLSPDRDLQLEVRQELRSHLDESIEELRGAGRNATDARDEALRALGDEVDLADGLWRANRRRMRLRTVLAWVARIALPPVVVALVVFLAGSALLITAITNPKVFGVYVRSVDDNVTSRRSEIIAQASPIGKLLFEQDESTRENRLPLARRLVEQNPGDAALYANLAYVARSQSYIINSGADVPAPAAATFDMPKVEEILAILAEGERREPGNALYPGMTAALLFNLSGKVLYKESKKNGNGDVTEEEPAPWSEAAIFDSARHVAAMDAFKRAVAAPYLRTYRIELLNRRMDALQARRTGDVWVLARLETGAAFSGSMDIGDAIYYLNAAAIQAVRNGRETDAEQIVQNMRLYAGKAAEGARSGGDVNASLSLMRAANQTEFYVHSASNADAARKVLAQRQATMNAIESPLRRMFGWTNKLDATRPMFLNQWWGRSELLDPVPMREAEYATIDQLGIAMVAGGLLLSGIFYAGVASVQWLRARRTGVRPPRLFVGTVRAVWVVGMGAFVPVMAFSLYTYVTHLSGRGYGLHITLQRVLVEYLALTVIVVALVSMLARRAIFDRMVELGTAVKSGAAPARRNDLIPWAMVILAAICLVGTVFIGHGVFDSVPDYRERQMEKPLLGIAWIMIVLIAGLSWKRNRMSGSGQIPPMIFSGSMARSAFPIVVASAFVVALSGIPHYFSETVNVRKFVEPGTLLTATSVGGTGYDAVRTDMIREYELAKQTAWVRSVP